MSEPQIPAEDEQIVEEAKADYQAYLQAFEKKFGYGIGAISQPEIGPDGTMRVVTLMKLVKLPPAMNTDTPVETPAESGTPVSTPQNGDSTTEEASPSDSQEQPASEAA